MLLCAYWYNPSHQVKTHFFYTLRSTRFTGKIRPSWDDYTHTTQSRPSPVTN